MDIEKERNAIKQASKNIEATGILSDLTDKEKSVVKKHVLQIDYDAITNPKSMFVIAPAVRRILVFVLNVNTKINGVSVSDDIKNKIINNFSINDVIEKLDNFYCYAFPRLEKTFTNIDIELSMLSVFCEDYVYGLVKQFKQ